MSLRDVLEYRAADSTLVTFSLDDLPPDARTIYSRPFGAHQWGYHSGEMHFDAEYTRSHTPPNPPA